MAKFQGASRAIMGDPHVMPDDHYQDNNTVHGIIIVLLNMRYTGQYSAKIFSRRVEVNLQPSFIRELLQRKDGVYSSIPWLCLLPVAHIPLVTAVCLNCSSVF